MVATTFIRLVAIILIVLLQVGNSGAQTNRETAKTPAVKGIELEMRGTSEAIFNKEISDISTSSELKNTRPGGRKMMQKDQRVRMDQIVKGDQVTEITGNDMYPMKKQPGKPIILSEQQRPGESKNQKEYSATRLVDDLPVTGLACDQHSSFGSLSRCRTGNSPSGSEKTTAPHEFDSSYQDLESRKLHEAANEIVNLMNKDYTGRGGPRHKPPINNAVPLSQEQLKP